VACPFVVFHHGSSSDFFGSFAVSPRPLRGFLDMLVHPLFLLSDTLEAFSSSRHNNLLLQQALNAPRSEKNKPSDERLKLGTCAHGRKSVKSSIV
jgi:hypothetical protein